MPACDLFMKQTSCKACRASSPAQFPGSHIHTGSGRAVEEAVDVGPPAGAESDDLKKPVNDKNDVAADGGLPSGRSPSASTAEGDIKYPTQRAMTQVRTSQVACTATATSRTLDVECTHDTIAAKSNQQAGRCSIHQNGTLIMRHLGA